MKKISTLILILSALLLGTANINAQGSTTTDKSKINTTVMSMLNQWDRQAYLNILDLMTKGLSYDTDGLADILNTKMDAMKSGTAMHFVPSVFNGHFELVNNRWTKVSDANDMQFTFSDSNGAPCVAVLTLSSNTKTMTINGLDITELDIKDSRELLAEYPTTGVYGLIGTVRRLALLLEERLVGVKTLTVDFPEKIDLTFTQNGKQMMTANVTFDLSTLTNDWELLTNGLTFSANMSFAKSSGEGTFDLILTDTGYKPGTGLNFDFAAKNAGTQILSFKVNAPGTFKPLDLGGNIDLSFGFQSLNIDIDVMGGVQLKGGANNIATLVTTLIGALRGGSDEASLAPLYAGRRAGTDLSDVLKIEFFYDYASTPSGFLTLLVNQVPSTDGDDNAATFPLVPIIHFNSDNTTYTCQQYFTPENFPEVQAKVSEIVGDAGALLDGLKGKIEHVTAVKRVNKPQTISIDNGQLNLSGQKAGARVAVYTLDGRLCTTAVADSEGKASVQLPALSRGVYILKTPAGTKKFAVR